MLPGSSSGADSAARYLRSTNLPCADFTARSSCISSGNPQRTSLCAGAACDSASAMISALTPVVIEVEPVVRRQPAMVLEAPRVALDPRPHGGFAVAALERDALGERLEPDLIVPAAAVQAEKQDHRGFDHPRAHQRAERKARRAAAEIAAHRAVVFPDAVAPDPDDLPPRAAFVPSQHRLPSPPP